MKQVASSHVFIGQRWYRGHIFKAHRMQLTHVSEERNPEIRGEQFK